VSTPRFTIITKRGKSVTGVVQGAGGSISTLARLTGAINRATRGHDSGIYEPKPGHAAVYPKYSARSDGKMVAVDMRGAIAFEAAP
jgi:hypothetical protein